MKKPRWTHWRWLLALLMGVGAWWGTAWLLAPRAYWKGSYENPKPVPDGTTKYLNVYMSASILDRTGRYLIIEKRVGSILASYEVIDLQDRSFTRHQSVQTESKMSYIGHRQHLTDAHGSIFLAFQTSSARKHTYSNDGKLIQYPEELNYLPSGQVESSNQETAFSLWHWNVLDNVSRLLRQYPRSTTIKISEDGSTLLEIERMTPLMPSLLLPASLPNLLAGQAEAQLRSTDLAVMRVCSLPDMKLRSTIVLPWIYRQDSADLTCNGAFLVLADARCRKGFESANQLIVGSDTIGSRGLVAGEIALRAVSTKQRPESMATPTGIRVYDTQTGSVSFEHSGYRGGYIRWQSPLPDVLYFEAENFMLHDDYHLQSFFVHLPSKQQLSIQRNGLYEPNITRLDADYIHWMKNIDGDARNQVMVMNNHGQSKPIAEVIGAALLLPHAPQCCIEKATPYFDQLPVWLVRWLKAKDWLTNWLNRSTKTITVQDYLNHRTLLTVKCQEWIHIKITNQWLLMTNEEGDHFNVALYALPFPSWSPWWARTAGFTAIVLSWIVLRSRKVKSLA